jgi:hypothetical protein
VATTLAAAWTTNVATAPAAASGARAFSGGSSIHDQRGDTGSGDTNGSGNGLFSSGDADSHGFPGLHHCHCGGYTMPSQKHGRLEGYAGPGHCYADGRDGANCCNCVQCVHHIGGGPVTTYEEKRIIGHNVKIYEYH